MLASERRQKIVDLLRDHGSVSVEQVSQKFGVSAMTVWRDLRAIEDARQVRRVRGGVVAVDLEAEPRFTAKRLVNAPQKQQIARYAAEQFVHDGAILLLEGGTTVATMVPYLRQAGLTLLTNGLNVLMEASHRLPDLTVICCGGVMRETSLTFVGPDALRFFGNYRVDICFLSATGLTREGGITDPNPLEVEVKRAMANCAHRKILLMDSHKFGIRSLARVMPIEEIDTVVVDSEAGDHPDVMHWLRESGIDVHVAPD